MDFGPCRTVDDLEYPYGSPPLSLEWHGDFKFSSPAGFPPIALDSGDPQVPSPMQALAYGLMGCMAMDIVLILQKGRHDLKGLSAHF